MLKIGELLLLMLLLLLSVVSSRGFLLKRFRSVSKTNILYELKKFYKCNVSTNKLKCSKIL